MTEKTILLTGVSYAQFIDELRYLLQAELSQMRQLASLAAPAEQRPYTVLETAKIMNVSRQTLFAWVSKGRLGCRKVGGRTYFLQEDINTALLSHKRTLKTATNARR